MTIASTTLPTSWGEAHNSLRRRVLDGCETLVIYMSIIALPFNNLPVIHEICLPLVCVGISLLFLRGESQGFVNFVRQFPGMLSLCGIFLLACVASVFSNLAAVAGNDLRGTAGWPRAEMQVLVAACMVFYPFYLAYCLSKRADWLRMIHRAIWISLPVPLFVGALQLAEFVGLPGASVIPAVKHYEGGLFRLNSVSIEAAWFDIYISIIFPFLILDFVRAKGKLATRLGIGATLAVLVVFFFAGFSKTPDIAAVIEFSVTMAVMAVFWRPAALLRWLVLAPVAIAWIVVALLLFAPTATSAIFEQIAYKLSLVFGILGPLITGDVGSVDIGTRFGMSYAGLLMWWNNPLFGVGLGQFAYNVQTYLPAWGVNVETQRWLSSDKGDWPAATVLYIRLLSECGSVGFFSYFLFRLQLLHGLLQTLKKKADPLAATAMAVFAGSISVLVFDMSRDTFINLDLWVIVALSLALTHAHRRQVERPIPQL